MKLRKSEIPFFTVWFIFLFFSIICYESEFAYSYNLKYITNYFPYAVIILLIPIILNTRVILNRVSTIIICALAIVISMYHSGSITFLWIMLFALAFGNIEFDRFIKFDFRIRLAILIFILLMSWAGVIDNYVVVINEVKKQSLGFSHPNTLGIYSVVLVVEYLYIHFENLNIKQYVSLFAIWFLLLYIGTSRAAVFLLLFIIVFTLVNKKHNGKMLFKVKLFNLIVSVLPLILASFCYLMATLYDRKKQIWVVINDLLTTRITWANYYYENYGVSLFGTAINPISARTAAIKGLSMSNSFDMGYVRIGVEFGFFVLLIFILAQIKLQKYIVNNNYLALLICNMFFLLLGIVENKMYSINFNVFLLLVYRPFFGHNINDFDDKKMMEKINERE